MAEKPSDSFDYPDMDWEQYMAHRPRYPAPLYDLVNDYHRAHGGKCESALDIGGGIGIITRDFLLQNFSHVTLSDPSEIYISQAKRAFASSTDFTRLSFVTRKIEDVKLRDLPNGPVDLITAGASLHWADPLRATPSAAQLIKSGGTFSAWTYGGQPVPSTSNPAILAAFSNLFRRFIELYEEKAGEPRVDGPMSNFNARFDNVPFDPKVWENVRRIKTLPEVPMTRLNVPPSESRVLPEVESQEIIENAAFISREVDHEWIFGYIQSLAPSLKFRENMVAELEELRVAMRDGEIELMWPFALVLASRR